MTLHIFKFSVFCFFFFLKKRKIHNTFFFRKSINGCFCILDFKFLGVFQLTKTVMQSNSFQRDNLNFTVQNIAILYNKTSIKFFLILLFLMWVLLKINFDNLWSVIAKCIKGPLMSTISACENVFTKQLIELLLILCGDVEQNPSLEKEKLNIAYCYWNLNGLMVITLLKFHFCKLLP